MHQPQWMLFLQHLLMFSHLYFIKPLFSQGSRDVEISWMQFSLFFSFHNKAWHNFFSWNSWHNIHVQRSRKPRSYFRSVKPHHPKGFNLITPQTEFQSECWEENADKNLQFTSFAHKRLPLKPNYSLTQFMCGGEGWGETIIFNDWAAPLRITHGAYISHTQSVTCGGSTQVLWREWL